MSTESISWQVVDGHRSLVEAAQPDPALVLADPGDHVEAGSVLGRGRSRSCTSLPSSS